MAENEQRKSSRALPLALALVGAAALAGSVPASAQDRFMYFFGMTQAE